MAAGFRVYNTSGYLQIDENYQNLCLVRKETVVFNQPESASNINDMVLAALPENSTRSVVATRSAFPVARVINRNFLRASMANLGQTATVYVFEVLDTQSPGSAGLRVFTPQGKLVFSSDNKYMRVVAMTSIGTPLTPGVNNSFPQGVYANVQASPTTYSSLRNSGGGADPGGTAARVAYMGTYQTDTGFGWGMIRTTTNTTFPPGTQMYYNGDPSNVLLLDVSNY